MKEPKVSICIAVYNGSNYLKEAIDSALAQTYKNCEVIVVNDGSNDDGQTEQIALSYGNKIRYLKKRNGGVASAMNMAIANMKGEYFAWLSHDDIYYPDKIKLQMEALEKDGDWLAPVFGDYDSLNEYEGRLIQYHISKICDVNSMVQSIYSVLLGLVHTVTVLVHKSHFERVGMFDESLKTTQDYDMWFRMFRGQHLIYVKKPLIKWRNHKEQGTVTISEHQENCDKLHLGFFQSVTQDEMIQLFGSEFWFYYEMYSFYLLNSFQKCCDISYQYLIKYICQENNNLEVIMKKYFFRDKVIKYIALYGAGERGSYYCRELKRRNVTIDYFIDQDPCKIGQKIDDICCQKLESIDAEKTLIIITPVLEQEIKKELMNKGYNFVVVGSKINPLIFLQCWSCDIL